MCFTIDNNIIKIPLYFATSEYELLLRGTLVNTTYGGHKNLYIHLFLPTIFGPIYYRPP